MRLSVCEALPVCEGLDEGVPLAVAVPLGVRDTLPVVACDAVAVLLEL